MRVARIHADGAAAAYRVVRPDWRRIGWAVGGRLAVAILGAEVVTIALWQGWLW